MIIDISKVVKSINKEVVAKEVQKIKEAILSSSENSKSIKIEED